MTTLELKDGLYEECSQRPNYSHAKSMHLHSWEILKDFPRAGLNFERDKWFLVSVAVSGLSPGIHSES